jgi:hypothetical protein
LSLKALFLVERVTRGRFRARIRRAYSYDDDRSRQQQRDDARKAPPRRIAVA